jgi:hypothetical protein
MTSTDRFSGPTARFSPEMTSSGRLGTAAAAERARLPLSAARRAFAPSPFAAHLELLLKEESSAAKGAGSPGLRRADPLGARADGDTDVAAADASDPARAEGSDSDGEVGDEGGPSASDDGGPSASDDGAVGRDATLDPMMQLLGALAPRATAPNASARPEPAAQPDVRAPVEQLMARLVRRVAWSGNGRSGVARLELGAGELEGATVVIHADDGVVRVALDAPPGVDLAAWKARISERLARRGLQVEAVEVG